MMISNLRKQNLIWGILLVVFGIAALVNSITQLSVWNWVILLFAGGLFSLVIYWSERSNLATMIPTYVLWSVAGLIGLLELGFLRDETIVMYVFTAIALPFVIGYLRNRANWGLLIPAYVLMAIGIMVWLIGLRWLKDLLIPAYVMFSIALPFLVVYLRNPKNWWALIPGGIMGVIGFSFLIATPGAKLLVPGLLVLAGGWIILRQLFQGKKGS